MPKKKYRRALRSAERTSRRLRTKASLKATRRMREAVSGKSPSQPASDKYVAVAKDKRAAMAGARQSERKERIFNRRFGKQMIQVKHRIKKKKGK